MKDAPFSMGHCKSPSTETASLLPSQGTTSKPPLKFPLGLVPESVRPYLELIRLEKPTGTKLFFWPFAWGLTMAAYKTNLPIQFYAGDLAKCLFGAFIMRSSACTINDIFDREVDAGVERTKNRPMPSGRVSVPAAVLYLIIQYIIGTVFFYFTLNKLAFVVALIQLLPLFIIYPLLKRITYWPQAWLGIAMNFGFVVSWVGTTGRLDAPDVNLNLYMLFGCWCWTMLYDTIYACQDKVDDIKTGVRSTAILFGSWIEPLLTLCGILFLAMLVLAGFANQQGVLYFVVSVGGTALHLIWQFTTVDLDVPSSCWTNFNRNGQLGWIIWAGLMLDYSSRGGLLPSGSL
jgi:4-hydroxybenzoate polyprenyltransferase